MDVSPDVADRLRRAHDGSEARHLHVADLRPGSWGVLDVVVDQLHPERTFRRKNGSEGRVGRATVSDATGSIDIVLWDGDIGHPALQPGHHVRIHGPTVKDGWKGGYELGLDGAEVTRIAAEAERITGTIIEIGATDVIDGRFRADLSLQTDAGQAHMAIWDDLVKTIRDVGVGATITLTGITRHPGLDGWYIADGARLA